MTRLDGFKVLANVTGNTFFNQMVVNILLLHVKDQMSDSLRIKQQKYGTYDLGYKMSYKILDLGLVS